RERPPGRHAVRVRPPDGRAPRRRHDGNAAALGAANCSARHPCARVAVARPVKAYFSSTGRADLFSLDVRGLEDRPPLLDLSLVMGRERLRILILPRWNLLAEIGEPFAHAGIG